MLAYAKNRPLVGKRQSSPHAMLVVIAMHVALIAGVMSAKIDLPKRISHRLIIVDLLPEPTPPPPNMTVKTPAAKMTQIAIDQPARNVPLPHFDPIPVDPGPTVPASIAGTGSLVTPALPNIVMGAPVRHGPKLLTPPSELRPPYPPSKILSQEEAVLRLRLTISDAGRVTAVDPIGFADREFLDAARRYLIAYWRYQAATEDGRPVSSSSVITLRFQLDG